MDTQTTVREFLDLPAGAMPGAMYLDAEDTGLLPDAAAWDDLRAVARGETPQGVGRIRLHAARPGWRDGVVIKLAEVQS